MNILQRCYVELPRSSGAFERSESFASGGPRSAAHHFHQDFLFQGSLPEMLKKLLAAGLILSAIGGAYVGYTKYDQHKFVSSITPHVKNVSLRLANALRYETESNTKITFKELFEKLETDISEIDKKLLDIQTASSPTYASITEPVLAYVKGTQELLRAFLLRTRKDLALSSAIDWADTSLSTAREANIYSREFALKAADKAMAVADKFTKERRDAAIELSAAATKMVALRTSAATYIDEDALVEVALLDKVAKQNAKEDRPASPQAASIPSEKGNTNTTVLIAHAGPLSGSIRHLGKDDENGVALAIDHANQKKLKIGDKTVTFKLMSEDDRADRRTGVRVAQNFVDAKVAAVIGHLNSGVSIPASDIYSKAGIPMITGSATNPAVTERGLKTVFRTIARDDQQGPAIAAFIAKSLKAQKVAIVDDQTAYGEGVSNELEKSLRAAGVTVVARESISDRQTNFRPILTKLKALQPDVVFHGGMDSTGGPMLKQARDLGIKATFAFGDGACTDEMATIAGIAAEGLICSQAGLPAAAASKEFQDSFKGKYGEIKQYAPYFYDGAMAVVEAMKKANSVDPAKFTPEIFNASFQGATGKVEFDAKGDRKRADVTIFTLHRGKIVPTAFIRGGELTTLDAQH